jgi:hypothetical protein
MNRAWPKWRDPARVITAWALRLSTATDRSFAPPACADGPSYLRSSAPMRRPYLLLLVLPLVACAPLFHRGGSEAPPPSSFVRSTAELRATRMIEVREGLAKPDAMKLVADALGQRYVVDVMDLASGFTMTAWRTSMSAGGVPDLRYRTRLIARFLGDDWRRLLIRSEANWARGDEWEIGYDVAQLDTATRSMRERLSPKP